LPNARLPPLTISPHQYIPSVMSDARRGATYCSGAVVFDALSPVTLEDGGSAMELVKSWRQHATGCKLAIWS
jgi:hypothetical protein